VKNCPCNARPRERTLIQLARCTSRKLSLSVKLSLLRNECIIATRVLECGFNMLFTCSGDGIRMWKSAICLERGLTAPLQCMLLPLMEIYRPGCSHVHFLIKFHRFLRNFAAYFSALRMPNGDLFLPLESLKVRTLVPTFRSIIET
jgi:hypothetical protein